MLLGNEKEWSSHIYNNVDESQNNYAAWKARPHQILCCLIPFRSNSRKCKLIYRDKEQISGHLRMAWEEEKEKDPKERDTIKRWGGCIYSFSWLCMVGSWVYTYVKLYPWNMCNLLWSNYTLIRLFKKNCAHSKTKQIFTSTGEWIKQNVTIQWKLFGHEKEWSPGSCDWSIWQHGWISKTCQVKEARHKGLHVVGSSLYEIYRKGKAIYQIGVCLGQR